MPLSAARSATVRTVSGEEVEQTAMQDPGAIAPISPSAPMVTSTVSASKPTATIA